MRLSAKDDMYIDENFEPFIRHGMLQADGVLAATRDPPTNQRDSTMEN